MPCYRIVWLSLFCVVAAAVVAVPQALAQVRRTQIERAQFTVPAQTEAPDPADLFRNQCGTCHVLAANDPPRQGPPLGGVFGRKAGSMPNFKYSAGFASADFTWDEPHLNAWLTKPQAVIPGAVMAYSQSNPETRKIIIDWLKEQH